MTIFRYRDVRDLKRSSVPSFNLTAELPLPKPRLSKPFIATIVQIINLSNTASRGNNFLFFSDIAVASSVCACFVVLVFCLFVLVVGGGWLVFRFWFFFGHLFGVFL